MMPPVFWTILGNATYIAAAFLLCALLGWLWFRPGAVAGLSQSGNTLARLAIYPILGWLLVIVGSSWLRIPAIPFRTTAPYLLALLLLVPLVWWGWRLRKEGWKSCEWKAPLWRRLISAACLLGIVLVFASVLLNRFTISSLNDVGVWGYDQVNYVHIADQYLDHGMFEQGDTPAHNVIAPWLAFNSGIFHNLSRLAFDQTLFLPGMGDWSIKRNIAMFMRNAGAATDASFATWLHLDAVQAYFLGSCLQYLFLALAGLWIGLMLNLGLLRSIFLAALASLWPMVVLPSLLDNRDQAMAYVIILVLLGAVFTQGLNLWARGLALGALALVYIEIFPLAFLAWLLLQCDCRPWKAAFGRIIREGGLGLGCCLPFVLWGTHYLGMQTLQTGTMKITLPGGKHVLGALSNFAGTFAGMRLLPTQLLVVFALVAGFAFLALQIVGWVNWVAIRRYFAAGVFLVFAFLAWRFEVIGLPYASYKLFTVLFPMGVLLCAGALQGPRPVDGSSLVGGSSLGGAHFLSSQRMQDLLSLLLGMCVPGLLLGMALRSGFSFMDFKTAEGMHAAVEGRQPMLLRAMTPRANDVIRARGITSSIKPQDGVLFSNFSRDDVGYFAHFLRDHSVWMLNGCNFMAASGRSPSSFSENMRPLSDGQKIDWLILLNDFTVRAARYDGLENLVILQGWPRQIQVGNTYTCLRLDPAQSFTFAQRLYSQVETTVAPTNRAAASEFLFGPKGIALGLYVVNAPVVAGIFECELESVRAASTKVDPRWECWVNGRKVAPEVAQSASGGLKISISLEANPAGYYIELHPAGEQLLGASARREPPKPLDTISQAWRMTHLNLKKNP